MRTVRVSPEGTFPSWMLRVCSVRAMSTCDLPTCTCACRSQCIHCAGGEFGIYPRQDSKRAIVTFHGMAAGVGVWSGAVRAQVLFAFAFFLPPRPPSRSPASPSPVTAAVPHLVPRGRSLVALRSPASPLPPPPPPPPGCDCMPLPVPIYSVGV